MTHKASINTVTHMTSPFTFFLHVRDWIDILDRKRLRIDSIKHLKYEFQTMLGGKGLKRMVIQEPQKDPIKT